jgi:hypothetical protein
MKVREVREVPKVRKVWRGRRVRTELLSRADACFGLRRFAEAPESSR